MELLSPDRKDTVLKLLAELDMELDGRMLLRSNQTKFQDAARTWIDFGDDHDEGSSSSSSRLPLVVIRVASQKDVEKAVPILVGLARDYDFPFRVQSGGHHKAGYSTVAGGAVLSLRKLKDIHFNKSQSMVTIGPGVRVEAFMEEMLAKRGYAGVVASAARVAQGGFVLGGGFGALSRRYGLGIDNVQRLRIVLADGSVQNLQDGELFWALRGGGSGSFGVVTEMDYKVYPTRDTKLALIAKVPMDHVGSFLHKLGRKEPYIPRELVAVFDRYEQEKEEEALAVFQLTWMGDGPNSIAEGRHYLEQEIIPLFPQREHTHTTFFDFSWSKTSQESEQLPWATSIRATQGWNGFLMPRNNTQFIWDNIQEQLSSLLKDCPHLSPNIELWGGAISDVASNDTAFAYREAIYNVGVVLMVPNGTEDLKQVFQEQVNKVSQVWPLIAKYLSGAFVNYPMASLANRTYAPVYWGSNLKRLVEIKRKYDPINAFSYEQSIPLHPKSMTAQLAQN